MTLRALPVALLALVVAAPAAVAAPPPLPSNWPSKRLDIGLADQPGGASALRKKARPVFRYQYLAGGYNTGNGWSTWNENGSFVSMYIEESKRAKQIPVFTYYMVNSSQPGAGSGESDVVKTNLRSGSSLKDMFDDLKLFFERAKSAGGPVVLHVEPDLWGYIQQSVNGSDAGADYEVNVSGAGFSELAGLPNNAAGFAQAIVRLRDSHAPNVILGYHASIWGTGTDVTLQDPSNAEVDRLAARAANFYESLGANFDVTFGEFDDRDSGFNEAINGDGGASWFKKADYTRHARFFRGYSRDSGQRIVLWQIPLGNTLMRAMNNQWGHFQDNKVQTVLGGSTSWLRRYRDAGVIAFLFGGGADGTTCACDATKDGKTNPAPINGNKRRSLSADDDGGYWASRTKAYYKRGALKLP